LRRNISDKRKYLASEVVFSCKIDQCVSVNLQGFPLAAASEDLNGQAWQILVSPFLEKESSLIGESSNDNK
jgi:hypothetical protein